MNQRVSLKRSNPIETHNPNGADVWAELRDKVAAIADVFGWAKTHRLRFYLSATVRTRF